MADSETTRTGSRSSSTTKKASKKTAKKSAARTSTAKKAGTKKASTRSAPRAEPPPKRMTGTRAAGEAARQLEELTGKETEGVTALERTDDGWRITVEVLELRRIPSTTDVLATYEVTVDEDGELEGYRRHHRYVRGTPGED